MAAQVSFWQRVGSFLRGTASTTPPGDGRRNGEPLVIDSDECGSAESGNPDSVSRGSPGFLARLGRRQPTTPQMRNGYQHVIEAMEDLREHFRRQDERTEQGIRQVERMTGLLEQLALTGRDQEAHIRSITEHVGQVARQAAAFSESLGQMPALLRGEAEAVRAMVRQMEIGQESDTQLMHSLQKLSQAVDTLQAAGVAQVQTLERLHAAQSEQREALTALVREQSRRFLVIIAIASILGLAALAALVTTLALHLAG